MVDRSPGTKLPWWSVAAPFQESQRIFALTAVLGGLCGLVAVSFHVFLDFVAEHWIYRVASLTDGAWWFWPLLVVTPALGGLLAGIGALYAGNEVRGSGIPEVKAAFYLDAGRIPLKVVWSKIALCATSIGSGASLGREGPTVYICSGIASFLGRAFGISGRNRRGFVPVGAAAGLAAAFNTPIAAVTFTLEEFLADTDERPLGSIVVAAVIAGVVERALLGGQPVFDVPEYGLGSPIELLFYLVLGIGAGFVAAALTGSILRLRLRFRKGRLSQMPEWAKPALGGLVVGVVGATSLALAGASGVFGVGYEDLSEALRGGLPWRVLLVLGVGKLIATAWSYASGGSGGMFGPSLFIGGMLGGAVGVLTSAVLGGNVPDLGAFVLVGMGAMFAGSIRAPVTSIIMIFEMTNDYSIILPLMLANISSYVVASRLAPTPFYDAVLLQDEIHLPHKKRHLLRQIPVEQAMTREVVTVGAGMSVREAVAFVQALPRHYHGYPVVDEDGHMIGLVTFEDLKHAMEDGRGDESLTSIGAKDVVHTHADHSLDRAIYKLGRRGVSQLPVVDRRDATRIVGILTMTDIAQAIAEDEQQNEGELL